MKFRRSAPAPKADSDQQEPAKQEPAGPTKYDPPLRKSSAGGYRIGAGPVCLDFIFERDETEGWEKRRRAGLEFGEKDNTFELVYGGNRYLLEDGQVFPLTKSDPITATGDNNT